MNFFIRIKQYINTHRKLTIVIGGISIVLIIAFSALLTKPGSPSGINQGSGQDVYSQIQASVSQTGFEQLSEPENLLPGFILNTVETLPGVNGYSWIKNQIIYSTSGGIFLAEGNEELISAPIEQIYWTQSAHAVYRSNNNWFLFNSETKQAQGLKITASTIMPHPTQPYLAAINNSVITFYSYDEQKIFEQKLNEPVQEIYWSATEPILEVAQKDEILLINVLKKTTNSFKLTNQSTFSSISPTADRLIFFDSSKKTLLLLNNGGKEIDSLELPETRLVNSYWLDNNSLLVIATTFPDSLGRSLDHIWLLNTTGDMQYLANSMPITNKLDPKIPVFINQDKNVIALIENQNGIWLLSLKPDQLPNYYEENIHFYSMPVHGEPD